MNAPAQLTQTRYVPIAIVSNSLWEAFFNMPHHRKYELACWLQGDPTVDAEAIFRSMPDVAQHDAEVTYVGGRVKSVSVSEYDDRMGRFFDAEILDALTEEQVRKIEGELE